jgi:pantetheine-phosphate adenylyltransferase
MQGMSKSSPVIAAYTGTFDPVTHGHADVIRRAARLFDELIVAVANNSAKKTLFDLETRLELTRETFADTPNIRVEATSGLIVEFAREHDVRVLVRGIRGVGDFEYERQMGTMNRYLADEVDTIFLAPDPAYAHISSTLVREIASLGGRFDALVPDPVARALKARFA